ncbi:MAG: MmcQ/YjbR family DNA-binding protein [Bacteroidales bacterium]|nr:MmcQ/YjbR family DNA-binding protein [Bacteroidales bacterium]
MNIEDYRNFCLSFKGVSEHLPFNETTLVFKIMGKMFALVDIDIYDFVNLKCVPEDCEQLRNEYEGISPGFHMNKKHWVSVKTDGSIKDNLLKELTKNSYNLIIKSLSKKKQEELNNL